MNLDKCKVGYKALVILGHLWGWDFTAADMFKVSVLNDIKEPMSGKQMHSILGLANYLRDYIPMFAHIMAKNLVHKLNAGGNKHWAMQAFLIAAALNARITRRHRLALFAMMFARKANYLFGQDGRLDSRQASGEEKMQELLERGHELIEIIYPAVQEVVELEQRASLGAGRKVCVLKVGTRVMVKVNKQGNKGQQRYKGPMTVIAYNPNLKAYRKNKCRKNKVQQEKLKVV